MSAILSEVAALVETIRGEKEDARVNALVTTQRLARDIGNRKEMCNASLGLLEALVKVIRDGKGVARVNALGTAWNLSCDADNRKIMGEASLGLLVAFVSVIREDKGEARINALGTAWNLSCDTDNMIVMCHSSLGLLAALVDVICEDKGEARINALVIVHNLSCHTNNRGLMGESSLGLLSAIVNVIREDKGKARLKALGAVYNISCDKHSRMIMGESSLGMLAAIADVIREDQGQARLKALGAIYNLSCGGYNKESMGTDSLGLLQLLVEVIREDKGDARVKALGAIWNLSILLPNTNKFVKMDLHSRLFDLLNDPTVIDDLREKLMTTIMVYCRYPPAARAFRELNGAVEEMSRLTHDTGTNGLRAAFILSQLVGRDENNSKANTQSLLESRPATLDQLIDVLENNIALKDGVDYKLGTFDLNAVSSAVLSLCTSDANKAIMVKSRRLLELLVQLLKAFIDNNPQYKRDGRGGVGGGGEDKETATYIIYSLLQLSFYYSDDELLSREYITVDLELPALLQCVLNLPTERKLEADAAKAAGNLLMRLHVKSHNVAVVPAVSDVALKRQHIMLSYSWLANKQLVVKLQEELMKVGYDVWRDEDGSSIVRAMSGGVDDRIAEAIENSYAVIICVSPQYKESGNCQMEGKYCNSLYKRKKLKILYVMMSDEYHTNSAIPVDGWLGLMIGDALWYPLWSDSVISATASSLIREIGDNAKRGSPITVFGQGNAGGTGGSMLQLKSSPSGSNAASPSAKQPIDLLQLAWETLTTESNATDTGKEQLVKKIQDLGLSSRDDLEYLEESEMTELSLLLRPVPGRKFTKNLNEFFKSI